MERTRQATLVIVDDHGDVLGATDPIALDLPWWQEAGPVADVLPGAVVLRLLEATPDDHEPMGGRVTYLVELAEPVGPAERGETLRRAGLALHPWSGTLDDHDRRQPWARPGGPGADLAWVAGVVDVTGPARQHRTWNLSAIWSIPTADGQVWLKCVPEFFAHEAAILEQLTDLPVPRLIAADGHRLLLADMPGEDGYRADEAEQRDMVETLVDIQSATASRVEALVAAGVPDLRTGPLTGELTGMVRRLAPDSRNLNRLVDELPQRLADVADCGLPDTLVHGDPHGGNCRRGVTPPLWFDWGDGFVGNPLLDVAAQHRMPEPVVDRWLDRWAEAVPGSDPRRAWEQLKPVAALRMAWVYQRFLDNIEPSEHIYHRDDVPESLQAVERILTGGS